MLEKHSLYLGRRVSYDGALCTIRCKVDQIPGTKGEWLGVEWDDPTRGKHNGSLNGVQYFNCVSGHPNVASFIRPTRKADSERTVLDAIRFKYAAQASTSDAVVISGKVAEEIGFDKVIKEQSNLSNLKVVILDQLVICGIAARGSSRELIQKAQDELAKTCPDITELDLSYNPIENWTVIEDICAALPALSVLKLNSIRFQDFESHMSESPCAILKNVQELHLNECLLRPAEIIKILGSSKGTKFPLLRSLWLSQNEMSDFNMHTTSSPPIFETIGTLMLENNTFKSLDALVDILRLFPRASHISLQSNNISTFGISIGGIDNSYTTITNLNLSANAIRSFEFVDQLSSTFPNLEAVRLSRNPFYDQFQSNLASVRSLDKSYYLTIARIPSLKSLNYTDITTREREEGEIYYLSVAEDDIRSTLNNTTIAFLTKRYRRYSSLCKKHDRDNLIMQLSASASSTPNKNGTQGLRTQYPPGSIASRLITCTFYIPQSQPRAEEQHTQISTSPSKPTTFTHPIPKPTQTSSIFALISRTLHLPVQTFTLIYESPALDPIQTDSSTRSQLNATGRVGNRWEQWGDWDADTMVERNIDMRESGGVARADEDREEEGRWTDDGMLVKDGKKWKRREVEILFGMRRWGDWFEEEIVEAKIRVQVVGQGGEK